MKKKQEEFVCNRWEVLHGRGAAQGQLELDAETSLSRAVRKTPLFMELNRVSERQPEEALDITALIKEL